MGEVDRARGRRLARTVVAPAIIGTISAPSAKPPAQPARFRRLVLRVSEWLGPENPERVIYGVLLIAALLAAESGLHDGYPDMVASAALGLAIYWLAHSYATALGRRFTTPEHLSLRTLGRALAHEWAIVRGAAIPLAALLVAWASGASQETGITVAVWSAVGSIVVFELLAGVYAQATAGELIVEAGVGIVLGLAILVLKALSGH